MGFNAQEEIEELTYDFNPYSDVKGTIAEPSSKQIEAYRKAVYGSLRDSGIPELVALTEGNSIDFSKMDSLLEKSTVVEHDMLVATADVTGIATATLEALPYRVKRSFLGWISGEFLSPEA